MKFGLKTFNLKLAQQTSDDRDEPGYVKIIYTMVETHLRPNPTKAIWNSAGYYALPRPVPLACSRNT